MLPNGQPPNMKSENGAAILYEAQPAYNPSFSPEHVTEEASTPQNDNTSLSAPTPSGQNHFSTTSQQEQQQQLIANVNSNAGSEGPLQPQPPTNPSQPPSNVLLNSSLASHQQQLPPLLVPSLSSSANSSPAHRPNSNLQQLPQSGHNNDNNFSSLSHNNSNVDQQFHQQNHLPQRPPHLIQQQQQQQQPLHPQLRQQLPQQPPQLYPQPSLSTATNTSSVYNSPLQQFTPSSNSNPPHSNPLLPPPLNSSSSSGAVPQQGYNHNTFTPQNPPSVPNNVNSQHFVQQQQPTPTGQPYYNMYPSVPPLQQQQQQQQQYQNYNKSPMYPQQQPPQQQPQHQSGGQMNAPVNGHGDYGNLASQMHNLSVTQQGFNKLWGNDSTDLLKCRQVLPASGVKPPEIRFQHEYMNSINCSPDLFRCTLTKIPESKTLLQKARLPLGILIHPFKDLTQLPVIQCSTIVRCRSCRTYINPFVYFVDQRRWKCNLCYRVNDLPEEFQYDPITKTYGDPSRRPEVRSATIEFLAPADYMVRPPQAAVYLYILEVTSTAVESGYLKTVCDILLEQMDQIPGDSRSQIGFITVDSAVHFYNLGEGLSQPQQLVVCDIDDVFIPCPDNLLVSLTENRDIIRQLLQQLPTKFLSTSETKSALGAALQAAHKLLAPIGGRITSFIMTLPTLGPGALIGREGKNAKDLKDALNPTTDYYKKLALDCSTQYIAVDLFFLNHQYVDIASISCVSKYSGGCVYHFPSYSGQDVWANFNFEQAFLRYVTRKIGFEAVMRVRCSRGMSIHTFHGNLFVRSTDLLSLPNCNPDAGFGMQVSIDESLNEFNHVCFQAALLYTSSKGERRIRVHTLCLPVVGNVNDVLMSADQQTIIGLIAKMAVDRSVTSSLLDAREAFINAVVDVLSAYLTTQNSLPNLGLLAPPVLNMLPAYTHAILRSAAFRSDMKVGLDERVHFMNQLKTLPLYLLIQSIYPDLYPLHNVATTDVKSSGEDEIPDFPLLHLCSDRIDANGVYLLDKPDLILVYVCRNVSSQFCQDVFGVQSVGGLNEMNDFPELDNESSIKIRNFVGVLQAMKPFCTHTRIIREDSRERMLFVNSLIEDRGESSVSYYEFLQQLKNMVK